MIEIEQARTMIHELGLRTVLSAGTEHKTLTIWNGHDGPLGPSVTRVSFPLRAIEESTTEAFSRTIGQVVEILTP